MITRSLVIREVGKNSFAFEAGHVESDATPTETAVMKVLDEAIANALREIQKTCAQDVIIAEGSKVTPESIASSEVDAVFKQYGKPA